MAVIYAGISGALDSRLNSMSGLPPVAWENRRYEPVQGTLYLRTTLLPGSTTQASLGTSGLDVSLGIYQIDVIAPINENKAEALAMADDIADQFNRGLDLTYSGITVTILNVSRRSGFKSQNEAWWVVPVEVSYRSFTSPR